MAAYSHEVVENSPTKTTFGSDDQDALPTLGRDKVIVIDARDIGYEIALRKSTLKPLSRQSVQLYFILAVPFLCAVSSGFDGALMSSINAMSQYQHFFGLKTTGSATGIVFAMYTIGNLGGALIAGAIADHFGRRRGMLCGSIIIIIGASLASASRNVPQFLGSRFLLGFGIAISAETAAPAYVAEISPPQWRGRVVGSFNTSFFIGALLINGITVATGRMSGTIAWRLPLALQVIPPLFVSAFILFLPESPRFLMMRGSADRAREILTKYHGNNDPTSPLVLLEMQEFENSIMVAKADKWWDFKALVRNRNAQRRFLLIVLMSYLSQFAGNGLTYFVPVLINNVGITSQNTKLLLNFVNTACSFIGAILGTATNDWIGRRPRLISGPFCCAIILAILAALTAKIESGRGIDVPAASVAAIVFVFSFSAMYAFVYYPTQTLYCTEVLETRTRARGMAAKAFLGNTAGIVNTYGTSVALGTIGWKMYLIWMSFDVVESVLWYFFAIETAGRTLEELDECFSAPNPVKASLKKRKVKFQSDGDVQIVGDAEE